MKKYLVIFGILTGISLSINLSTAAQDDTAADVDEALEYTYGSVVAVSPTQVNLAWTDNATNETGFRLWRFINFINGDTSPASWIASLGVDVTTYTDGTVSSDTSYQYAIQTFNAAGGSAFTYVSNVITPVSTTP